MRIPMLMVVLMVAGATASGAEELHYGYPVGTASSPPLVVTATHEPHVVLVPNTQILKVNDRQFDELEDMFRFAGYWYVCKRSHWYRATGYRGPYFTLDVRQVPTQILIIPAKHWRHAPLDNVPLANKSGKGIKQPVAVVASQPSRAVITMVPSRKPAVVKTDASASRPKPAAKTSADQIAKKTKPAAQTVVHRIAKKSESATKTRDDRTAKKSEPAAKKTGTSTKGKNTVTAKTSVPTEKKKAAAVKSGNGRTAKKQKSEASKKKASRGREINPTTARRHVPAGAGPVSS